MTPQELKNSILQLAIQGKLVPQLAEEGTAEELYSQIQAEKQKLIQAGKIKKEKTLPAITNDEKPFEIPDSWKWVRLGETLNIARGGSPRPIKNYLTNSENGINWIKIGDTNKGSKYIYGTNEKIIPEGMKKSRFVKKGDFLLSNSMSFGRPYILNIDGCIHDGWLVLSPLIEIFYKDYLYYLLSSNMVYNQFCRRVSGAVVNNLNSDKVSNTVVSLPPLAEQKRIVAKIEELLPYVERYEKAYNELQQLNKRFPGDLQKSVLQLAIQGRLVSQCPEEGNAEDLYKQIQAKKQNLIKAGKIKKEKPLPAITDDEKPFEIPDSWKWVRLGEVFTLQAGKNITSSNIFEDQDKKHKYLCYGGNGIRGYVSNYNRQGKYAIIGRQGALCGNVNIAEGDFYATEHAVVVDHYNLTDVIWSSFFIKALNLNQYATATAQPGLAVSNIVKVLIPLPPLAEQKRIVNKLEEILPLCDKLKG